MKFITVTKKNILLFFILVLLIFLILLYFIFHYSFLSVQTSAFNEQDFYSKIQNLVNQKDKIAYLTFDDGPTLKSTSKILDILKSENVKATFFVIGKHVKENPELVKRAYIEGHYIANHGYTHDNTKLYSSAKNFINEIKDTDIEIGRAIGIDNYSSCVFRFPNGYMSSIYKQKKEEYVNLLPDINYTYIDWNCLNKDSEKKYNNYELLNNL